MNEKIEHIDPDGLRKNPAFSQVVTTRQWKDNLHYQDAVNSKGEKIGKGDIAQQTEQVMQNSQTALAPSGATFQNIVKLITAIQNLLLCY